MIETASTSIFREQLTDRRRRLEQVTTVAPADEQVRRLIHEVDAALQRIELGSFGLCETCHDPIETDRLLADPLTRFCLDHLTALEQRALQRDLDLAARIQRELLPKPDLAVDGWDVAFHYQAAGPVSGDYCDLVRGPDGSLYVIVGDVAGKGVAAAMLMSHLSAMLRALISTGLPLDQLMERASRVFCESTLPTHYATMVCACASPSGEVEVCNAGHPPPFVIGRDGVAEIGATNLPIGMFCTEQFKSERVRLNAGDTMFLYTDGYLEAQNEQDEEYGLSRVRTLAAAQAGVQPRAVVDACVQEFAAFRGSRASIDDVTIMAVRRHG
jgi:sigma-B regulation protein RsbU (phosphoserine phosphatase)